MSRIAVGAASALVFLLATGRAAHAEQSEAGLVARTSSRTGLTVFVAAPDGGAIAVLEAADQTRPTPREFLLEHGHLFGVDDPDRQLMLQDERTDALGYVCTTYQQVHGGVPVFSGVLKLHRNATGEFLAANGRFYSIPSELATTPTLSAEAAAQAALDAMPFDAATVVVSQFVIVDPGWYGDPSMGPHLAYHIVVTDAAAGSAEAFFVDAHKGMVLDRWSLLCGAIDRAVHLHNNIKDEPLPGPLARAEGDPPTGNAQVDAAYDYLGDVYGYYQRGFGRDGLDGAGMTMVATVNSNAVPCPNAAWSFVLWQAVFCPSVVSDDLVGHEMTHGVTQSTANLIYQNQSGQLNESFSDVFGELIDLFNGNAAFAGTPGGPPYWPTHPTGPGTDTANNLRSFCSFDPEYFNGVRWLFGEDASGFGGPLRDLWDPTCLGDPDRANSPLQTCNLLDNGGVHSGSGIPNHAFALLCDGGSFNGYTVSGIGPIKAGAVWYRALAVYLTVASDFEDAYWAINQAAADLVGAYPNDPRTGGPSAEMFTAADAVEVDEALRAVEMNTPGACGQSVPVLNSDPPTQCSDPTIIFADDFEGGASGWTVSNTGPPTPYDWAQTTEPLPFGRSGAAWLCADANIGHCLNSSISMGKDDCSQADFINGEGTFRFSNAAAAQDGPADCSGGIACDVWFCWTATCDGTVTLTTCGLTSVNTKIAVYDGCGCPAGTLLACNDDSCGLQSAVTFAATEGSSYLIRVGVPSGASGASGGSGKFSITSSPSCGEAAVHSLFSPVIALPAEVHLPMLAFTHFVETEPRYDGGNVSMSIDGGAWQRLPTAAYRYNRPNAFLFLPKDSNNPLAGQVAFTGVGGQWGTSLVDLGTFVSGGEAIQFRFDFGKDACFGFTGWFLDDLVLYDCAAGSDCNANGLADEVDITDGPAVEEMIEQLPNHSSGSLSDNDPHPALGRNVLAEDFDLLRARRVNGLRIWGAYTGDTPVAQDNFSVRFYENVNGLVGAEIAGQTGVASSRVQTGAIFQNISEWEFTLTLNPPVQLAAGRYFVSVYNDTTGNPTTFVWERAITGWIPGFAYNVPGCTQWCYDGEINMSLELLGGVVGADCNANATPDECEIEAGSAAPGGPYYCTAGCDPDCNVNGVPDECEFAKGDVNLDQFVNADDIGPFVTVLLTQSGSPDALCAADISGDGLRDGGDIAGFVGCVTATACP